MFFGSLLSGIFVTAVAAGGAYLLYNSQKKEDEEKEPKIKMLN